MVVQGHPTPSTLVLLIESAWRIQLSISHEQWLRTHLAAVFEISTQLKLENSLFLPPHPCLT